MDAGDDDGVVSIELPCGGVTAQAVLQPALFTFGEQALELPGQQIEQFAIVVGRFARSTASSARRL